MEGSRVDRLIKITGGLGRWQIGLLVLATWTCVVAAINHSAIIFLGLSPTFQCADQPLNSSDGCLNNHGQSCQVYRYDQSDFKSTLVTKWDLVCGKAVFSPLIQGTYFGGVIMGNLIGGPASDIFGRRPTLMLFTGLLLLFSHTLAFIDNYVIYLMARFIVGGSCHALFAIFSVSVLELMPISKRILAMTVMQIGWIIGNSILSGLGYFLKDVFSFQVFLKSYAKEIYPCD